MQNARRSFMAYLMGLPCLSFLVPKAFASGYDTSTTSSSIHSSTTRSTPVCKGYLANCLMVRGKQPCQLGEGFHIDGYAIVPRELYEEMLRRLGVKGRMAPDWWYNESVNQEPWHGLAIGKEPVAQLSAPILDDGFFI